MVYPKSDFKRFYLPTYLIWMFVSPTLILLGNYPYEYDLLDLLTFSAPYSFAIRLFAFFMIFGFVWPLMIVTYPAFYDALVNDFGLKLLPWEGSLFGDFSFSFGLVNVPGAVVGPLILWLIAFYGPFISLGVSIYLHKRDVANRLSEEITWGNFFGKFI